MFIFALLIFMMSAYMILGHGKLLKIWGFSMTIFALLSSHTQSDIVTGILLLMVPLMVKTQQIGRLMTDGDKKVCRLLCGIFCCIIFLTVPLFTQNAGFFSVALIFLGTLAMVLYQNFSYQWLCAVVAVENMAMWAIYAHVLYIQICADILLVALLLFSWVYMKYVGRQNLSPLSLTAQSGKVEHHE